MNKNPDATARRALAETEHKQRPHTLIEEAYRKIKQMLLEQKFAPGQRLVNSDLAEILSMSRTPIINALNRLVQDGFIGFEGFRGFYVRPIDAQEVWDAFGVREALEVYAVEQAIKLSDTRDMVDLEEKLRIHAEYKPHYYTRRKFILDSEFHLQIAAMAKNQILRWLLQRNFEHIFLRARLDNYDPRRMDSSAREHHDLVGRMKRKDILGSIERVRGHIQKARDEVVRCLSTEELEEAETGEV
ncbi:MAG: GntR family transcriptional regulator [Deltaproteobacteria bacterium]|nr:MAG: GntR family transcriptional regulator [Deltaproteobacteria bacterium]